MAESTCRHKMEARPLTGEGSGSPCVEGRVGLGCREDDVNLLPERYSFCRVHVNTILTFIDRYIHTPPPPIYIYIYIYMYMYVYIAIHVSQTAFEAFSVLLNKGQIGSYKPYQVRI